MKGDCFIMDEQNSMRMRIFTSWGEVYQTLTPYNVMAGDLITIQPSDGAEPHKHEVAAVIDLDNLQNSKGYMILSGMTLGDRISNIVTMIKNHDAVFTIEDGIMSLIKQSDGAAKTEVAREKQPIVCIINGYSGSGKDTLINAVSQVLDVEYVHPFYTGPIDEMVECIRKAESREMGFFGDMTIDNEIANKTDKYRTLLYDLKTAWDKFNMGMLRFCLYQIDRQINEESDTGVQHDVVFIPLRSPADIKYVRDRLVNQMGIITITVLIKSWVTANDHPGTGDDDVENYPYDIVIKNHYGEIKMFQLQATMFAQALGRAIQNYGIDRTTKVVRVHPDNKPTVSTDVQNETGLDNPIM